MNIKFIFCIFDRLALGRIQRFSVDHVIKAEEEQSFDVYIDLNFVI
jgi:hypothetical protein